MKLWLCLALACLVSVASARSAAPDRTFTKEAKALLKFLNTLGGDGGEDDGPSPPVRLIIAQHVMGALAASEDLRAQVIAKLVELHVSSTIVSTVGTYLTDRANGEDAEDAQDDLSDDVGALCPDASRRVQAALRTMTRYNLLVRQDGPLSLNARVAGLLITLATFASEDEATCPAERIDELQMSGLSALRDIPDRDVVANARCLFQTLFRGIAASAEPLSRICDFLADD